MWTFDDAMEDRNVAIAMLRAFRGMTQDQLAAAAGLAKGTVSLLESGQQEPRDGTFGRIVEGVDVNGELACDLLRWIRRARAADRRRACPQDRRLLARDAAAELAGALEDLLGSTCSWIEERRAAESGL